MKKLYLLLLSLIFIICIIPKTYAIENYDTSYTLVYDNYYESTDDILFSNTTLTTFYSDLLSYYNEHNNYYYMIIANSRIYLLPINDYSELSASIYGYTSSNGTSQYMQFTQTIQKMVYFEFPSNGSTYDIMTTGWYSHLKDCLNGSVCTTNRTSSGFNYSYSSNYGQLTFFSGSILTGSTLSNDSDAVITGAMIPYFSSIPIKFEPNSYQISANNVYLKNIIYLDITTSRGGYFPTYLDSLEYEDFVNFDSIGNIYVGGIPKNNLSSVIYKSSFNYVDSNYVDSLEPQFLYFGRINNTTYYSYEKINCSSSYTIEKNESTNLATINLFSNGISCSSDLTNYDNIYIRVYYNYDNNSDSLIKAYKSSINYGYTNRLKDSTANYLNSYIYERFENFSSSSSIVLSSDYSLVNSYFISNSDSIVSVSVDRNGNILSDLTQNPISYGSSIGNNILIYDTLYDYVNFSNIDLFIDYRSIVSISNNDVYTYYDSNNDLTTNTIINDHTLVDINDYNISYYNNIVSNFIDSFSNDITSFSLIIQSAYDSAPDFLQIFIYVVFILICIYFIYRLILRR